MDNTDKNIENKDIQVDDKKIIKLTKHYSPDSNMIYYFIRLDNLNLYSNSNLKLVQERFNHILDIGLKAYIEEIRIKVELVKEAEVEY